MADAAFRIVDLTTELQSGDVSTKADVWLGVDDDQGTTTSKKMNLEELETLIGGGGGGSTNTNTLTVTSHGYTSADEGKPIGWTASAIAIWDDAADPQVSFPAAILKEVVDANTLSLAYCGEVVTIADSLLPTGVPNDTANSETNSRFLYWDKSAGKYQFTIPDDAAYNIECVYYIKASPTASYSLVQSLLPSRPVTTLS